ncbi:hypothetical protein C772_00954 [Bhargavaea cecembensis DSE10]|uniref:Permuted papain-like amidase enzyme, YaeF/YiiX, C92 family n=2 Tax=Bhargavaea cecembensis TaxID=394098 RepID=M7P086_9BACL|nr:hypothetical protein C772_00954 [Bhargavaea cecembensis DSE10]
MRMRRGDVVFVQGKGIISQIIRYFDEGKFSHCAIVASHDEVIEADYNTRVALRRFREDKYNIIEVIDLGLTWDQRSSVYESAMGHIGKRYDYVQLLWYMIRKVFRFEGHNRLNNPKHMICSELVFIVLDEIGVLDDLEIRERFFRGIDLTPNELYDLVCYVAKCKPSKNPDEIKI